MKYKIIFATIGFFAAASFALPAFASTASSSIKDSANIEGIVLGISKRAGYEYEFGTIRIEAITQYRHHQDADFEPLKIGDEVFGYFKWGTAPRKIYPPSLGGGESYVELSGIGLGDKIQILLYGCPEDASCGTGWRLYRYTVLERAHKETPSPEPSPSQLLSPVPPPEPNEDTGREIVPLEALPQGTTSPGPAPNEVVPEPRSHPTYRILITVIVAVCLAAGVAFFLRKRLRGR